MSVELPAASSALALRLEIVYVASDPVVSGPHSRRRHGLPLAPMT